MPIGNDYPDPQAEQSMWAQLDAWDKRRTNFQSTATPIQAAAIGRVYKTQPDLRPGATLAIGQAAANNPSAEQALVQAAQKAQAKQVQAENEKVAAIPGLTPEQQAAAKRGMSAKTPYTPEQLKAERQVLGVPEQVKTPSPGFLDRFSNPFDGFDPTSPTDYFGVLGRTASDVAAPVGFAVDNAGPVGGVIKSGVRGGVTLAQGGVEMVQTRGVQGLQSLGDIGSALKEGDLAGAGSAFLQAQAAVNPFSVAALATAPEQAKKGIAALTTTTAYQAGVKGLSTGEGYIPNPQSPAGLYQSAAAREVRGVVPGTNSAWTIGRIVAAHVTQPGTTQYDYLSGLTDAAVAWYGDPLNPLAHTVASERAIAKTILPAGEALADSGVRKTIIPWSAEQLLAHPRIQNVIEHTAASDDALEIWNMWGRKLAPAQLAELKGAKTTEQVSNVIRGQLGLTLGSTEDIPTFSRRVAVTRSVKKFMPGYDEYGQPGRALGAMPRTAVVAGRDATAEEQVKSLHNIDRYLSTAKVDSTVRSKIVNDMVDAWASGSGTAKARVVNSVTSALEEAFVAHGVNRTVARDLLTFAKDDTPRLYGVNKIGEPTSWDMMVTPEGAMAPVSIAGPHLLSEGLASTIELADPRMVRRMTSKWNNVLAVQGVDTARFRQFVAGETGQRTLDLLARSTDPEFIENTLTGVLRRKPSQELVDQVLNAAHTGGVKAALKPEMVTASARAGQLRLPLALAESIQNQVWKPLQILRVATTVRIVGEEQVRMAASGFASIFAHPIDAILTVTGHRANVDALGLSFKESAALGLADDFKTATNDMFFSNLPDPHVAERHAYVSGGWNIARKDTDPANWIEGMAGELRQLSKDDIAARYANGLSTDQMVGWLKGEGRPVYDELIARGEQGFVPQTGGKRVPVDFNDEANLRNYLESVRSRLMVKTGGDEELLKAVGSNVLGEDTRVIPRDSVKVIKAGPKAPIDAAFDPLGPSDTWLGSHVRFTDADGTSRLGIIDIRGEHLGDVNQVQVRVGSQAFLDGQPSEQLMAHLGERLKDPNLPDAVKYKSTIRVKTGRASGLKQHLDWASEKMFGALFDKPTNYLSRSPLYRQDYYKQMAALAEHLTPEDANRLLKNLEKDAAAKGFAGRVDQFIGNDALDSVVRSAGVADGTLGLEQADQLAKARALDTVKSILYDSSEKSNLSDALRIVAPFGEAFKEVLTRWAHIVQTNPYVVKRGATLVQGARDAGFFYTDPNGNEVFGYGGPGLPGGLTGLPVEYVGNVTGLNIAGNFLPSLGPLAQIPAWWVLKNKPDMDWARSLLLPYGEPPTGSDFIEPSWFAKIRHAVFDDPNSAGIFGSTYIEVLQSLKATGQYPNTPEGRNRLENDATHKARTLAVLRGIGQFILPSAPHEQFTAETRQGDVLVDALSKEYAALVSDDPTTAPQKFIDRYGEGPFTYVVSKSRAVNGGLSPSEAFGDWERLHPDLFERYKTVAGYFAPTGDDFSFEVYSRQLASGERVKLSDEEFLDAVDTTLARWQYNAAKAQIGAKPTADQRTWLAQYKAGLEKKYPGYARPPATTDLPTKIKQLGQAAADPGLADNKVASATRAYLRLRDQALKVAHDRAGGTAGLTGQKMADLREWLDNAATAIVKKVPEFSRVYDSVLSGETQLASDNA